MTLQPSKAGLFKSGFFYKILSFLSKNSSFIRYISKNDVFGGQIGGI